MSSLRSRFHLDHSLRGRRWQAPIIVPAIAAACLVVVLSIQLVRAIQVHRRVVDSAMRDYAAFATWQYTRRASDYLRLVIASTLPPPGERWRTTNTVPCEATPHGRESCNTDLPIEGHATCAVRGGRVTLTERKGAFRDDAVEAALAAGLAEAERTRVRIGVTRVPGAADRRYVGFWFRHDSAGRLASCEAMVIAPRELIPVFEHVAGFAPLLPRTFVGELPNDSLVSVRVSDADGESLAAIGRQSAGMSADDVLGPNLADLRVTATLHPAAMERLAAGGAPAPSIAALVGMLVVTLMLSAVAVLQLRRGQEIIRLRSDFVTGVSHELKTPLAQISLFADTLASPRARSEDDRRRYLAIISREAKRLGQLVDNVLHFAGMMRGVAASTLREASSLSEEARSAVAAFEPLADAQSAKIRVEIEEDIELALDRDGFRQLLLNLLDNALKYGPEGQTITVGARDVEGVVYLWVDDQGPGVPAEDRARAFEPFVRADRLGTRAGSGIGLAVVHDVATRHGGSVRIADAPGGGARVEVTLPGATRVVAAVEPGVRG